MEKPADHPAIPAPQVGVLLVNLGTPDDASPAAVRRYLKEFLSDPRVVEIRAIVWQPILRGIILNTRPKKSAAAYAKIWDHDAGDSPLRVITRAQAAALQAAMPGVVVDWAMRYGNPSIEARLSALRDASCTRLLVAPLYPQYSAATTATVVDTAFDVLKRWRWQPALRTLPPYHDDPAYIDALARSIETGLANLDFEPELLITSFHGMPARTLRLGDPYHCHCQKTARLLTERLGWAPDKLRVTFQSRFGRAEWLKPYTDATLRELPAQGIRRVAVIAPGFAADCLETLEEIAMQGRETFEHAGGERFAYLPCLNASTAGIDMMQKLMARELEGWVRPA